MKMTKKVLSILLSLMLVLGAAAAGMSASALERGTFLRLGDIRIVENGEIKTASGNGWSFEENGNGGILNFDDYKFEYGNGSVITAQDLDLTITGSANLTSTDEVASAVVVLGGNLTLNGNFRLRSQHYIDGALAVYGNLTVDGGSLEVINNDYNAINVKYKMTVNSGVVYARSEKIENKAVTTGEFVFNNDETFVLGDANSHEALIAPVVEISSYNELKAFATRVNGGETRICARLTNDIDASADNPLTPDYTAGSSWTPIGNGALTADGRIAYSGVFDGCGHTITGLYFKKPEEKNAGLFGYIQGVNASGATIGGIVKNVCLKGGEISGRDNAGGVAGYNDGGIIENCCNTSKVTGSNSVGGIAGKNSSGLISNCCNTGWIMFFSESGLTSCKAGGIAGFNTKGNVYYCYNTGRVHGYADDSKVGGVVGYNFIESSVIFCYNTGIVAGDGWSGGSGGVVGDNTENSRIINCYNTDSLRFSKARMNCGGVVGYNDPKCVSKVFYCYYDSDIAYGIPAIGELHDEKVAGLSTAQMTGTGALDNMVFEDNFLFEDSPWILKENDDSYFYYPHLAGFNKDSQGNQLAAQDIAPEDWPARLAKDSADNSGATTVKAVDCESEITTGYRESKRFDFEAENMPEGATAHVFYNGEDRGEGTSIEVKEPTEDYTVECKVLDADGNEIASSGEIKVKVKNSFFDRLKWFFNNFWANILKTFIDALIAAC